MLLEKKRLSVEDLEAQTALELPDREMLGLVNVVVFDVIDINNVNVITTVTVKDNKVAVQICNVVVSIASFYGLQALECDIRQIA